MVRGGKQQQQAAERLCTVLALARKLEQFGLAGAEAMAVATHITVT